MGSLLDLKGRNALVTGAGQGVGRQVVHHFANHNAGGIVINDYYQERADAVAEELRAAGVTCKLLPIQGDVTKLDDVLRMVETAQQSFGGPIQILVNNAGVPVNRTPGVNFIHMSPEDWDPNIKLNLYGVLNTAHAVIGGMVESRYGKIVTVISDSARTPAAHLSVYAAAKAGAASFMRSMARELGGDNITCNCVALGATHTPSTDAMWQNEAMMKKVVRNYLLPRLGEPVDAANAILFLSSDASSWITGQTLPVNGGFSVTV